MKLKSKFKILIFLSGLVKSIFLIHQFFKKHPRFAKTLKNIFLPGKHNNHTPQVLRPPALSTYVLVVILAKVLLSSYLFLSYPTVLGAFTGLENEIIDLINSSRELAKVSQLEINPELTRAAQAKASDMIKNDYFAHFGPDGKKPWDWIDSIKYSYSLAGENLAKDFITASAVHRALMSSATHKENILNPRYHHLGLGLAAGKIADRDTMVLVEFFGAPLLSPGLAELETKKDIETNLSSVEESLFGEVKPAILSHVQFQENPENLKQLQNQDLTTALTKPPIRDSLQVIMSYLDYFMFAVLVFLALALLLNIFIQIRIQKPQTILSTLVVIGLILAFMFTNFHFLEGIAHFITIK